MKEKLTIKDRKLFTNAVIVILCIISSMALVLYPW